MSTRSNIDSNLPSFGLRAAHAFCTVALLVAPGLGLSEASAQGKRTARLPAAAGVAAGEGAAADEPGTENKSDKLDVTDLDRKYWAAKDTDFSVVQNRTYSKAGRLALSAQYGVLSNDPYSDATVFNGALTYYFSERLGLELGASFLDSEDNKSVEYFKNQFRATPDHGKVMSFYGAALVWVPFYAKMSVLNSEIIYFDMQISPGLGVTTYDQQLHSSAEIEKTSPTLTLDVTQHFFLNKNFAARFDFKNRWFQEEVISAGRSGAGGVTAGEKVKDELTHISLLLVGGTFFF